MVVAGEAAAGAVPGAASGATLTRAWRVLDGYPYYAELFGGTGADTGSGPGPGSQGVVRPPTGLGQPAQHFLPTSTLLNPLLAGANFR
jgi:hypothetical protein